MVKISHDSYTPSHPALFAVDFSSTSSTCLKAQKVCSLMLSPPVHTHIVWCQRFAAGETICSLEGPSKGSGAYTTVQCGPKDRIELRSDLAYGGSSSMPPWP